MNRSSNAFVALDADSGELDGDPDADAAAGAGVLVADELNENDGEFDPLEKVEDALDDDDDK